MFSDENQQIIITKDSNNNIQKIMIEDDYEDSYFNGWGWGWGSPYYCPNRYIYRQHPFRSLTSYNTVYLVNDEGAGNCWGRDVDKLQIVVKNLNVKTNPSQTDFRQKKVLKPQCKPIVSTKGYHLQNNVAKHVKLELYANQFNYWDLKFLTKVKVKVGSEVKNCHTLKLVFGDDRQEFFCIRKRDISSLFPELVGVRLRRMGYSINEGYPISDGESPKAEGFLYKNTGIGTNWTKKYVKILPQKGMFVGEYQEKSELSLTTIKQLWSRIEIVRPSENNDQLYVVLKIWKSWIKEQWAIPIPEFRTWATAFAQLVESHIAHEK